MKRERLGIALPSGILLAFILLGPAWAYLQKVNHDREERLCQSARGTGGYCYVSGLDDGLIHFEMLPSSEPHCCLVNRENISYPRESFSVLLCSKDRSTKVSCANYEGVKGWLTYVVDGVELSEPNEASP